MTKKVVIDAGHGKPDPGAVNGSKHEADATLAIAKKVGAKLKAKGVSVLYTRTKNEAVSLKERCAISNTWGADVFVSLHLNASTNASASGIETWRYPNVGARTKALANNVQSELVAALGWKDRGVKTSSTLYVLRKTSASAILVECGFISNDAECKKLFNDAYQTKIADAIARGILKALA